MRIKDSQRLIASIAALSLLLGAAFARSAEAAGRRRPSPLPSVAPVSGRRVITLAPIRAVRIELPDSQVRDMGNEFRDELAHWLYERGHFIIDGAEQRTDSVGVLGTLGSYLNRDPSWTGTYVPSAEVTIVVEALSFETGARGDRTFYGFDERFRTPFNDGFGTQKNEFPLRSIAFEPNWFDRPFDQKGEGPGNSREGLDLGQGFRIEAVIASVGAKYARYLTNLQLRLEIEAPLFGLKETRRVIVNGKGFYFDIVAGYQGFSAGIQIARREAFLKAHENARLGSIDAIERALSDVPLAARVDGILADGTVLMGTGMHADVPSGTRYVVQGNSGLVVEVLRPVADGALGHVVEGDPHALKAGQILLEKRPAVVSALGAGARAQSVPSETVDLPWKNIPKSDLSSTAPHVSFWTRLVQGVGSSAMLPYRAWRYFQYDQSYHVTPSVYGEDDTAGVTDPGRDPARDTDDPDQALPAPLSNGPVVAVIDSGVDYQHPLIQGKIWVNDRPVTDSRGRRDRYGWDFVSNDPRPYDDHYHGTQIAGTLLTVAPNARVMPLKIFNPWGITTSAAIYGAFHYAVDHGARAIVCAWATRLPSQAIEQGVAYAREHGVLVIAAAGDRGDSLSEMPTYPAALASRFDNLLVVTATGPDGALVAVRGRFANFDPDLVALAAPGQGVKVSEPRARYSRDTGTGLAAARVAGAVVRVIAQRPTSGYLDWIAEVRGQARAAPALAGKVRDSLLWEPRTAL